ncbi:hypothetical protein F5Y19DRAFT_147161 [Xylariaceae sp. FL1651]|nr:hypothetical protein F5Y19DRAFT_147161 [Xylariaceae sp. FL1651]
MASLQTYVLENDQWVTRTISADELIGESAHSRTTAGRPPAPKPPTYGLLTKTIIESPIIRWVLPVQLRSSRYNDVAFVRNQSVQIYELDADMQLQPIAQKADFGSRIRNCLVMGNHDYLRRSREDIHASYYQSGDTEMADLEPPKANSLPKDIELFQQILVLVLETGELVFLFMNPTATGDWQFISSHSSIASHRLVDPGFHMTISPSWDYLALACSENLFIIYQLESIEELRRQHRQGRPLQPILSVQARAVRGLIHKIDFLHPGSEDISQIILLVFMAQSGVSRLAIYDWDNSEALQDALAREIPSHRLEDVFRLPLLIIPLTVCREFLIITEHAMAICSDVLSGPPSFVPFELAHRDDTPWHHGTRTPMWTAWTRPMREGSYHADTDLIYLAREDGWINCLEIRGDSGIESSIYMGPLDCNIDSAFASLSIPHGEVLVAGGDSSPGAVWSVQARQDPQRIGPLPNWSPTVDLVLTKDSGRNIILEQKRSSKRSSSAKKVHTHLLAPEKIFACSCRGAFGAITELHYGIQAKIGLDLLYSSPIRRCWAIPSFDGTPEEGFSMLIALPENSALLHVSYDLSEVSEKGQNTVQFDLLSTTLAVYIAEDIVVQITTTHATILSMTACYQHSISDIIDDPLANVTDAAIADDTLALAVYSRSSFKINVINFDKAAFTLQQVLEVKGEITALSITKLSGSVFVLAGLWLNNSSTLAIFPIDPSQSALQTPISIDIQKATVDTVLVETEDPNHMVLGALTSIICVSDDVERASIVVGTRNGDVLTIQVGLRQPTKIRVYRNQFGVSPSHVFTGMDFNNIPSVLVCNDAGVAIMKNLDRNHNTDCFRDISRVWLTDAVEPSMPSPTVNSIARLHQIPGYSDSTVIMIAGPRILITELQSYPTPIPRYLPVKGTPLKILYSERLEALVTVVVKSGAASLHFLDPTTGLDLSHPVRKVADQDDEQHVDVDYITYLGNADMKIVSLLNWRYKNKGNLWEWFVILAKLGEDQGRLLVVSAEQEVVATDEGPQRRIRFWTQFHRKIKDGSPRAGTTDEEGLFLGIGSTIEYHTIEDKKFKTARRHQLPSPATWMEVVDGHLHVLTTKHSLIILDYMSNVAIESQQMVQIHTDDVCRNGLHSIDVGSAIGAGEGQKFALVSDPMGGIYGLWSPSRNARSLKLVLRAQLAASIRKFVRGRTRPPWVKGLPRYGHIQSIDGYDMLGLAIDGSLVQFSFLHEDTWRLLRYIQNLAMASKKICLIPCEYGAADDIEMNPDAHPIMNMHINGDILQRCLEQKALEEIVTTPQQLARLQELLRALDPHTDITSFQSPTNTSLINNIDCDSETDPVNDLNNTVHDKGPKNSMDSFSEGYLPKSLFLRPAYEILEYYLSLAL